MPDIQKFIQSEKVRIPTWSLSRLYVMVATTLGLQLLSPPVARSQNTVPTGSSSFSDVGAIAYDSDVDRQKFCLCNADNIAQYYQVTPVYRAGPEAMKAQLRSLIGESRAFGPASGIVTVRFLINCHGAPGRFRVSQVDEHYMPCTFPPALVARIKGAVQQLLYWKPGTARGKAYDSYYFLSFRLKRGTITQIFPL
ncbi:hypothetical protein SAMN04488069_1234 [Hymenobacter psychrophilus]|uniref:TonB protein C-terminal n=1 Tax=Hymenobacter psychrophilus TaxID=651662 RepID=A0A1H3P626_9BACT|nr:hypothetical protein SAMN04488069_1234 [Hymenobacter psychrophilus]